MSETSKPITLPNGMQAFLFGADAPSTKRAGLSGWPASASRCAVMLDARVEALMALDDLLHWRELGAKIWILANRGLLLNEPAHVQSGEVDALVEVSGVIAGSNDTLLGCLVSASDDEPCRLVSAAALKTAWLDLGGWALMQVPADVED